MNTDQIVWATVKLNCDQLTDNELAAMNICVQLGTDPRQVMGYEKAKPLFTNDLNGIPQAHNLTRQCMASIVMDRFKEIP